MHRIPIVKPFLNDAIKRKVEEVLDSRYWTEGPVTREFEEAFAAYVGASRAIAVTSCTTGMEIALRALGIGPGDEVIVPDYTYPATASVVAIVGATPVIVDVSPRTLLIDYDAAEAAITPRTRAIMPVSEFGNPLDYDRLNRIKSEHGLVIVEDAACGIGSSFKGTMTGNLADLSVFSLHPRKTLAVGEGGMITTNRADWAEWLESYKHFGMQVTDRGVTDTFVRIGTNYKLSNILSAIGLVQLEHLPALLEERLERAAYYVERFGVHPAVDVPATTEGGTHSRQSFCISIDDRDAIKGAMRAEGIEVQIGTYALHQHPAFGGDGPCRIHGDLGGSAEAYDRTLTLPLYAGITRAEQDEVVDRVLAGVERRATAARS